MTEQESGGRKLTNRQKVFIEEYLVCWNASEAARRAGYTGAVEVTASKLLRKTNIQEAISARMAEKAMKADEVLLRLAEIARAKVGDFITEGPRQVVIGKGEEAETVWLESGSLLWDEVKRRGHLIKKISFSPSGPVIEMEDRMAALQLIGRHHKLFTDVTETDQRVRIVWDLPTSPSESQT